MTDPELSSLMRAASERLLAVDALQKKYEASEGLPTEQLVRDMSERLPTERVVVDAVITIFAKLGPSGSRRPRRLAGNPVGHGMTVQRGLRPLLQPTWVYRFEG